MYVVAHYVRSSICMYSPIMCGCPLYAVVHVLSAFQEKGTFSFSERDDSGIGVAVNINIQLSQILH